MRDDPEPQHPDDADRDPADLADRSGKIEVLLEAKENAARGEEIESCVAIGLPTDQPGLEDEVRAEIDNDADQSDHVE